MKRYTTLELDLSQDEISKLSELANSLNVSMDQLCTNMIENELCKQNVIEVYNLPPNLYEDKFIKPSFIVDKDNKIVGKILPYEE